MMKAFLVNPNIFHQKTQMVSCDDKVLIQYHFRYYTPPKRLHSLLLPQITDLTNPNSPPSLPSYSALKTSSVYALDNGFLLFIWIGLQADLNWIKKNLVPSKKKPKTEEDKSEGHLSIQKSDNGFYSLQKASEGEDCFLDNLVSGVRRRRDWYLPLVILRESDQNLESWFKTSSVYALDNGFLLFIWIGLQADLNWIKKNLVPSKKKPKTEEDKSEGQ